MSVPRRILSEATRELDEPSIDVKENELAPRYKVLVLEELLHVFEEDLVRLMSSENDELGVLRPDLVLEGGHHLVSPSALGSRLKVEHPFGQQRSRRRRVGREKSSRREDTVVVRDEEVDDASEFFGWGKRIRRRCDDGGDSRKGTLALEDGQTSSLKSD
jgi:hypothetical protein